MVLALSEIDIDDIVSDRQVSMTSREIDPTKLIKIKLSSADKLLFAAAASAALAATERAMTTVTICAATLLISCPFALTF